MLRYIIYRCLLAIPTLWLASVLAFGLSRLAPGDPIEALLAPAMGGMSGTLNRSAQQQAYRQLAQQYGLELPAFYWSWQPAALPDTLHRLLPKAERENVRCWFFQTGDWQAVQSYYVALQHAEDSLSAKTDTTLAGLRAKEVAQQIAYLRLQPDLAVHRHQAAAFSTDTAVYALIKSLRESVPATTAAAYGQHWWRPRFVWHGWQNQYHRWAKGFVTGDWGISVVDQRAAKAKIGEAVRWTLLLNLTSLVLAFLVGIPLGAYAALRAGTAFDRALTLLTFMAFSIPTFWLATIAIMFFTTSTYSSWLDWFASVGLGDIRSEDSFWRQAQTAFTHLLLPVLCMTYIGVAYIARQMRSSTLAVLTQPYIRTAYAKGLTTPQVFWRHIFKNAAFPLIVVGAGAFGELLAGSVTLEVLFNIPGMGRLLFDAIGARDWNVVFAILMLSIALTLIANLLADLWYAYLDPRVRL